jgi:hypothetical protein
MIKLPLKNPITIFEGFLGLFFFFFFIKLSKG